MDFSEIKKRVKDAYERKSFILDKQVGHNGRIEVIKTSSLRDPSPVDDLFKYSTDSIFKNKLAELKGIDGSGSLNKWYWDYIVEIYNENNGNISGFEKSFKERSEELLNRYYWETNFFKQLYLSDEVGCKVYKKYPDVFLSHMATLCRRGIFRYERYLKERDTYILELLINHRSIYEVTESIIDNTLKKGQRVMLCRADLQRKIITIQSVLDQYLFDPGNKYQPELKKWEELNGREQKEFGSNFSNKRVGKPYQKDTPQEEIELIVKNLFEKVNEAGKIIIENSGVKSQYEIIHQNDHYNKIGQANVNQILKYFQDVYPELINIEERWFKERIETAILEDMM